MLWELLLSDIRCDSSQTLIRQKQQHHSSNTNNADDSSPDLQEFDKKIGEFGHHAYECAVQLVESRPCAIERVLLAKPAE